MLVFVQATQIGLADSLERRVPEYFGQCADFQTPVAWDAVGSGQVPCQRKLACEWVPKVGEEMDESAARIDLHQCSQQRRDQQPHHAAVHAVGHACVIGFAEFKIQGGIDHGQAQPRKQLAVVVDDVAVVQDEDVDPGVRQQIAECRPNAASLARCRNGDAFLDQFLILQAITRLYSIRLTFLPSIIATYTQPRHAPSP